MKCDRCGIESDFEEGFIKERKAFRSSQRSLCRACWVRGRHSFEAWYQVAVIIGGIAGYIMLWMNHSSVLAHFLTTILLIDLFLILTIIPHELGHAIAAKLLGWRTFAVVIGLGKQAFKFHLSGIAFSIHWLPIAGITRVAPIDARWFRVKRFFIFLAGPAVNGAIAATILLISRHARLSSAASLCVWANLWVMASNLWPRHLKTTNLSSDGKQLLKTFSRKLDDVEKLQATRFALEAVVRRDEYKDSIGALEWCNKGLALFPHNIELLTVSGMLRLDQHDFTHAREIFLRLLKPEVKPDGTRYIVLNNIAYAGALSGDPQLLPEADAYSREAHAAIPWVPAVVGTRGTVLLAMGQVEEGMKLLQDSFKRATSPRSKAENACHLAIANARMGNPEQSRQYLKLAEQLYPECRLIDRVHQEFQKQTAAT